MDNSDKRVQAFLSTYAKKRKLYKENYQTLKLLMDSCFI